jgi:hypothetical protein
MSDNEIILTRSTRRGVEKLDFEQNDTGWRVVLERPGAKERSRPKEIVKQYATTDDVWKDIELYAREGYKIVLYNELMGIGPTVIAAPRAGTRHASGTGPFPAAPGPGGPAGR